MLPVFAVVAGACVAAAVDSDWAKAIAWQNEQWDNRTGGRQGEYQRAVERANRLDRPILYVRGAADLVDPATGLPYEDDSYVVVILSMLDTVVDLSSDGAFWTEVKRIAGPERQAAFNIFNLAVADVGSRWQQSRYASVMGVWSRR